MKRTLTISLDWDWFYRQFGRSVFRFMTRCFLELNKIVLDISISLFKNIIRLTFYYSGPEGVVAKDGSLGTSVAIVVTALAILIAFIYQF